MWHRAEISFRIWYYRPFAPPQWRFGELFFSMKEEEKRLSQTTRGEAATSFGYEYFDLPVKKKIDMVKHVD